MEYDSARMISKTLTSSDTSNQGRVQLIKDEVDRSLICYMSRDLRRRVCEERKEVEVVIVQHE